MAKLYSYVRGKDIVTINDSEQTPIIDGIINQGDYVLFIAEEKVGKTIFSQQLCCSLSTGKDFLNVFPVNKPCKIWYMFNEVRIGQIQKRFINMSHGIDIDLDNITLIPFKFRFNTPTGHDQLQEIIHENKNNYPDVIILDCLYKAVKGSLKDDNVINDFNFNFSSFANAMGGCARIVVHHLTKPSKDVDGSYFARTDKDSFGSAFLLADVDHVFRLEKYGADPTTKERILKCDTQRSGNIIETTRIRLIEPDPLYYEYVTLHTEDKAELITIFNKYNKLTRAELMKHTRISKTKLFNILKTLLNEDIIYKFKEEGKEVYYSHVKNRPIQDSL
jgi:hypothetical protein